MRSPSFSLSALLLTLALAAGSVNAQPAPAQTATTLLSPAAWELAPDAQWLGAQLKVSPSAKDTTTSPATRAVSLPAGASWRATLTIAALQPEAIGAAVALTLHGADNNVVAVTLLPQERNLVIARGNAQRWLIPLLEGVRVPDMAGTATAPHTLVVESQGSRLRVSVDGQEVGTGDVMDMEPVRIGVRASNTQAVVHALTLDATGANERLGRLSGARAVPGAAVLMNEDFRSKMSAAGAAKAVTGLFGRMLGKADAASTSSDEDAWSENWLNENSRFERDTSRKRLVLEGLHDDAVAWNSPSSTYPLDYAGTAVTARIRVQANGAGHRAGVMLQARAGAKPKRPDAKSEIAAMWGDNMLWLHEYDAEKDDWSLLRRVPWPANGAAEMTLRLVTRDDKAWVFVDGRLVMHHTNVEPLKIGGGGLRAEGRARLEASSFVISEI